MISYKIRFCFPTHPKIILNAFISAKNEVEAKSKFDNDYPNFSGCEIITVDTWK